MSGRDEEKHQSLQRKLQELLTLIVADVVCEDGRTLGCVRCVRCIPSHRACKWLHVIGVSKVIFQHCEHFGCS